MDKAMKTAIVGLGYVGLPLSLQFARSGVTVLGLDVDSAKVDALHQGKSYIKHIPSETVAEAVRAGTFSAATRFRPNPGSGRDHYLRADAAQQEPGAGHFLHPRHRQEHRARICARGCWWCWNPPPIPARRTKTCARCSRSAPASKPGADFHLAFSPEREDPGNPDSKVALIPKVVGGYTPACLEKAVALYSMAVKTVVPVSSCRAAEATKLLENTFRGVNIALVNELKMVYSAMGIDVWEVINAAKTKPFGFMPFYPGPGLGGHCIPIDPFYLTWKAREYGQNTRFIELAGEINTAMPEYVVHRVADALNDRQKAIKGSSILVLGLAYKPNVDDERESPSYVLMEMLKERGAKVAYYDPYVPVIRPTREHGHWAGTKVGGLEQSTP